MVGIKEIMGILNQTADWTLMGSERRKLHIFVALLQEVCTDLPSGEVLDWRVCTEILKQVLEVIRNLIIVRDTLGHTPTYEVMSTISKIEFMAMGVNRAGENMRKYWPYRLAN